MFDLFWKRSLATRSVLGLNERNRQIVAPENPRRHLPLVDDKRLTKALLEEHGIPTPKTLGVFDSGFHLTRGLPSLLEGLTELVLKPAQGAGGGGILVLARDDRGWVDPGGRIWSPRELVAHGQGILFGNFSGGRDDAVLAEERLYPGPVLGDLEFSGLPDIRVIVHRGEPRLAMIRVPTKQSRGKANLHQGGIGVGLDLATGETTGARWKGRDIDRHPDTGQAILGRTCCHWDLVLEIARRSAAIVPLGYLGVDIAPTKDRGPVVLELNGRPGLEIQNANGRGLRDLLGLASGEGKR